MNKKKMLCALALLCALIPCAALAADISPEAAEAYAEQRYGDYADGYLELMPAFAGAEWDGWTVVSSIDDSESAGVAVLEKDGAHSLAMLEKGADGWRVALRDDALFHDPGLGEPQLCITSMGDGERYILDVYLDGDMDRNVSFWWRGGELSLLNVYLQDVELAQRLVPELSGKALSEASLRLYLGEDGGATIDAYVSDAKGAEIFSMNARAVDPARFALPAGLSDIFARMGACVANRNGAPYIPQSGKADALPQPRLAAPKQTKKYDVYTGPGTNYLREANGKASVSTKGWVQVFGEENGWLLVQYNVKEGQNRFGYIKATQKELGVSVPALAWARDEGALDGAALTSDPLVSLAGLGEVDGACAVLGSLGNYAYVETTLPGGKRVRAFTDAHSVQRASDYAGIAAVAEETPLYASAEGEETLGALLPGARVETGEAKNGRVFVTLRDMDGERAGADTACALPEGWADAAALTDALDGAPEPERCELAWTPDYWPAYAAPDASDEMIETYFDGYAVCPLARINGFVLADFPSFSLEGLSYVPEEALIRGADAFAYDLEEVQNAPQYAVAADRAALLTEPAESGARIAELLGGTDVYILGERDGYLFVDTAWGEYAHARLRGYVRREDVAEGFSPEPRNPVVRIDAPEGERFEYNGLPVFNGAEAVLRAVSADGKTGVVMLSLGLDLALVPSAWLTDTGRTAYANDEALGESAALVSADGGPVPAWYSEADLERYPEGLDSYASGTDAVVLARRDGLAQVVVSFDGWFELAIVREENVAANGK